MNDEYETRRIKMVEDDIYSRGIREDSILNAMKSIVRHEFVPEKYKDAAYSDRPLPIGYGQTISQPYIAALMVSMLKVEKTDKILEIGAGSGYLAAILSLLCNQVYAVEIIPELVEIAKKTLEKINIHNVTVINGDGNYGWQEQAPYDGIIVSAASTTIPPILFEQLVEGGRLIAPVGDPGFQILELWYKKDESYTKETGIPVSFVPLVSKKNNDVPQNTD